MKTYLIGFDAEYYCQGYEKGKFTRFVYADSFDEACKKIQNMKSEFWEIGTATNFINLTINDE